VPVRVPVAPLYQDRPTPVATDCQPALRGEHGRRTLKTSNAGPRPTRSATAAAASCPFYYTAGCGMCAHLHKAGRCPASTPSGGAHADDQEETPTARYATTRDDDLVWAAVAPERPCPVCGATCGCGLAEEGFVLCARVASAHPVDVGGWLHAVPASADRCR
jgi:hypothetical protein